MSAINTCGPLNQYRSILFRPRDLDFPFYHQQPISEQEQKHSEVPAIAKPRGAEQRPFNQQLTCRGNMSKVSPNGNYLRSFGCIVVVSIMFFVFQCGSEEWKKLPLFQMGWGFTSWTPNTLHLIGHSRLSIHPLQVNFWHIEILRWHAATSFQDLWKATIWFKKARIDLPENAPPVIVKRSVEIWKRHLRFRYLDIIMQQK